MRALFLLSLLLFSFACQPGIDQTDAQENEVTFDVKDHYQKSTHYITMRDGVRLYTTVYSPKDNSQTYPIMMMRTCYSSRPYGENAYRKSLGPSTSMMEEGYIFVYQDVRGRYMSEGTFDNMRPIVHREDEQGTDEATDTFDTIDWLVKNIPNNNGNVGQWGISYPGHYTTAGALSGHPALKTSSPQACIADFYFDDFHHRGAYTLSYWGATPVFGYQKEDTTRTAWYRDYMVDYGTSDLYDFFLKLGPLKNSAKYYGEDNFFWQDLSQHPDYDEFWQKRDILPHLKDINHAVMVVGGWFDAEDLYGPLKTYSTIEENNPNIYNTLVMGPWSHGDWSRNNKEQIVGNISFGEGVNQFYQDSIEARFFRHFLKEGGDGKTKLPEAYVFDTGKKAWRTFDTWPPKNAKESQYFLEENGQLMTEKPSAAKGLDEYISDPSKPVPYSERIKVRFTPRPYMTDDQRFASRRPDVLVYETEVLEEDVTMVGDLLAKLKVSTSGTDSDWIVKLIDVYPDSTQNQASTPKHISLGGYQQMVRSEIMRGKYRESFSKPVPFVPNQITDVDLPLQDVFHTFKRGHRIMIQIQSSWFPLFDRNPQTFVDNIFMADEADFILAHQKVYRNKQHASAIHFKVL
ncbi:CocE/NonD family hydrolase [Persicobacter diffluens]|uniref:Glutaryl-7-ACA acylase n=1 Tax=Persicobacter diffluens TaxID=981 RepID=A0AAN4W353_9BACT|nr:glutaryl-7-ACA acylase [Persicobacter diffluens]